MQRNIHHTNSSLTLSPSSSSSSISSSNHESSSLLLPHFAMYEKDLKDHPPPVSFSSSCFRSVWSSFMKHRCFWITFFLFSFFFIWVMVNHTFQFHVCDGRCFFITWRSLESTPHQATQLAFPCHFPSTTGEEDADGKSSKQLTSFHLHQSWKTSHLPSKFQEWSNSWKHHHPNWTYHLWTDQGNRELIEQRYPWFLPFYDGYPKHIMRVDAVRYLYLHAYGGIYADLDLEALQPFDKVIQAPVVLGWLTNARHGHALPNAFMAASQPGHPFWLLLLAKSIENQWLYAGVEQVTGPHMLTEMVLHYMEQCQFEKQANKKHQTSSSSDTTSSTTTTSDHSATLLLNSVEMKDKNKKNVETDEKQHQQQQQQQQQQQKVDEEKEKNVFDRTEIQFIGDIQLLPTGMIYPYSWINPGEERIICSATSHEFNASACKALFPKAYSITYWTHSWGHNNILLQD